MTPLMVVSIICHLETLITMKTVACATLRPSFFDDGTISMNEYSFGQIQRIVMFDGGDVKPWSDVAITYGVKRPEGIQIHRI